MPTRLSEDEKIALAGIVKWVISADHNDSLEGLSEFFQDNGWGSFNEVYEKMDQQFEDLDSLKDFLQIIGNKEAQEIIVQVAKDIITSDVIVTNEEKKVLDFLHTTWNV